MLPVATNSRGCVDDTADISVRLDLAEKAGKDVVYMELEKPSGRKVRFLVSADAFKKFSKTDIAKLYRGVF